VGKKAIVDAYEALKTLLKTKFGHDSKVMKAVEELEGTPESEGRKATVQEEVTKVHADQDPDIQQAAQAVLNQINAQPFGVQHIQQAIGSYIAQADRGSTANVNINSQKER
jgi:hypothetical protein